MKQHQEPVLPTKIPRHQPRYRTRKKLEPLTNTQIYNSHPTSTKSTNQSADTLSPISQKSARKPSSTNPFEYPAQAHTPSHHPYHAFHNDSSDTTCHADIRMTRQKAARLPRCPASRRVAGVRVCQDDCAGTDTLMPLLCRLVWRPWR